MDYSAEIDNITVFDGMQENFSEAYYVLWTDPERQLSMVVRYVLLNGADDGAKICEVWGWFRDRNNPEIDISMRRRYPLSAANICKDKFCLEISESGITDGKAWGNVSSSNDTLVWEFNMLSDGAIGINRFPDVAKYNFFPQFYSPGCKLALSGRVIANGCEYTLDNINGSDGHYWNTHNLCSWNWGNCVNFREDPDFLFEGISARFNPWAQPSVWMFFYWKGELYQSNIIDSIYHNREVESGLNSWQFSAEINGIRFDGRMTANPKDMILITHPLPDGNFLYTTITLTADLVIDISRKQESGDWAPITTLTADRSSAFEVTTPTLNEAVEREFPVVTG